MTPALIVLGGVVYIGLSLAFRFTPRLRVLAGLLVGGLLAGRVAEQVTTWLGEGTATIAKPLANLIGQSVRATAAALPTVIAFALAIVVVVFLRGRGKGTAAGRSGGGGRAGLAHAALVCALLLPIVAASVGEAVRSVAW